MSDLKTASRRRRSVDGQFDERLRVIAPAKYREIRSLSADGPLSVQGAGLSYAAAAFGAKSTAVDMRRFNRILEYNPESLTIRVEGGAPIGSLHRFLAEQELYLSPVPGHPSITIGGCIAGNVHGKNPCQDGTFSDHVLELSLFHPRHGLLKISPTKSRELFDLTCGGLGLTGIIVDATLRLRRLPGQTMLTSNVPFDHLEGGGVALSRASKEFDVAYGWCDLASEGELMGRGFLTLGRFSNDSLVKRRQEVRVKVPPQGRWPRLYGRRSVAVLNRVLIRWNFPQEQRAQSLEDALFPVARNTNYFRGYGKRGFIEHQILIPRGSWPDFSNELVRLIRKQRPCIGIAILKCFSGQSKLLRFGGDGISLALHLSAGSSQRRFSETLDELAVSRGVIANPIKDSRLSADVTRLMYPDYELFRSKLREFDPARLFRTVLSDRLEL